MVDYLKQKSKFSKDAAELLEKHGYGLSCVHCAYYSCHQLMSHKFKKEYQRNIKAEFDKYVKNNTTKIGSHQFEIGLMRSELRARVGRDSAKKFGTAMESLLKLRHEADYGDCEVSLNYGGSSIALMADVLSELD